MNPLNPVLTKLEYDEYDHDSLHCLIIHKSSDMPAACVRLVPAVSNNKQTTSTQLPFEKYCTSIIDNDFIQQLDLVRNRQCEISRLAVD